MISCSACSCCLDAKDMAKSDSDQKRDSMARTERHRVGRSSNYSWTVRFRAVMSREMVVQKACTCPENSDAMPFPPIQKCRP